MASEASLAISHAHNAVAYWNRSENEIKLSIAELRLAAVLIEITRQLGTDPEDLVWEKIEQFKRLALEKAPILDGIPLAKGWIPEFSFTVNDIRGAETGDNQPLSDATWKWIAGVYAQEAHAGWGGIAAGSADNPASFFGTESVRMPPDAQPHDPGDYIVAGRGGGRRRRRRKRRKSQRKQWRKSRQTKGSKYKRHRNKYTRKSR